ncbi:MAG: type II toxin-antitoxin system RelE/ParE family toxin [Hyphomicrobiales bacterium]|nr:type II toxin-antitoxin system RelE/ParE family toxin [Hyphomicrobiales bacterium]
MTALNLITVVETGPYLEMVSGIMNEAERTAVVNMIASNPRAGDLIQGTGGLRKVRVPLRRRGKRGGGRVITFFCDADMPVFLLAAYAKSNRSDLDQKQRNAAKALTRAIRAQYGR